jgi:hypothetical protein
VAKEAVQAKTPVLYALKELLDLGWHVTLEKNGIRLEVKW